MGEVFLDAFLDTLKILPFLLVMNFLIEFIEYRSKGLKADKLLGGGIAPILGTAVGIVPQCGFSVVATELYGKKKIALGTLLAVYIATSDEALPIMLSSYDGLVRLWPVLLIKVAFALVVGYTAFGIQKLIERTAAPSPVPENAEQDITQPSESGTECDGERSDDECKHELEHDDGIADCEHEHDRDGIADCEHGHDDGVEVHIHGCHHHSLDEKAPLSPDAGKKERAAWVWNVFFKHPLIHTGTVLLFIFAVNVAFGLAIYFVGEESIAEFLSATGYLQPVLAAVVGLIPNCAGSVVITELYVVGGLNLGGAVAGLCMSAGIGYAVLIRENRPVWKTVVIIVAMYALSASLGLVLTACGL